MNLICTALCRNSIVHRIHGHGIGLRLGNGDCLHGCTRKDVEFSRTDNSCSVRIHGHYYTGIAGFTPAQMAPLFARAREVENICLPARFWAVLERL